jgi:hypothetical protein
MSGKGDKRRPSSVSQSQFDENWNKAFNRSQIQKDWREPNAQPTDLWAFPSEKNGEMLREVTYDGMWKHSCTTMMETFYIGKDEVCDACGAWEEDNQ